MKKWSKLALVLSLGLLVVSCGNDSIYKGFQRMENGAYMKFYSKGDSEVMPRLDDEATFEMAQYFNDSLLFTTFGNEPMRIVLKKADFQGDVSDGLQMMHVGDSARLVVLADSVLITMLGMEEVPAEYVGKPIYYDLKLLSVKSSEVLAAERKALLDILKGEENAFLTPLRDDSKNTQTESGLIILEKSGKGKPAKMGEYVDFDFTMCNPKGDTIMNSFGIEAVEMQYGEEFICEGFTEALGLVPAGGSMRFVIPSELAFDSAGYEHYIQPFTPLVVLLRMNSVMDKETYEKRQAELEAKKEAELERLMSMESKVIEDYIKANGISETPTESGLYIIRKEEGKGDLAKWGDHVAVHYILSNLKGDEIESSYEYEQPFEFRIGNNEMIPAIEEAVMTMAPGAKVTLITPSELAFGEFAIDDELLPPYSPMKIELELVEIK